MNPGFESKWVKVGDINTHCLTGGEGPPLVLIHGAGVASNNNEWNANIEALARHYRVYVPDLVGYGRSDKPRVSYHLSLLNDFFRDWSNTMGLEQASLIGHSLGGAIALDFTLKNPQRVKHLILVDSAGLSHELGTLGKILFSLFTNIARIRRDHVYLSLMTGGNNGKPVEIYMDRLGEIKSPALILWGGWDGYVPPKLAHEAHKRLQNSRLHIFPRCWHAPQRQRAREFNRIVLDFLRQETA